MSEELKQNGALQPEAKPLPEATPEAEDLSAPEVTDAPEAAPQPSPEVASFTMEAQQPLSLDEAYALCCQIAKQEAKNFYYSFLALTPDRRNAMCAIYAFMRKADDLVDDEHFSREHRRKNLNAWLVGWKAACEYNDPTDPVFMAVLDAVRRFQIPLSLLDELVEGVSMDLVPPTSKSGIYTYQSFNELYRYCYLVASVVGLVCIHIFGYKDKRAEKLAEETGIAFQLTNILRDVAEDGRNNRVYLPIEDLQDFKVPLDGLIRPRIKDEPSVAERKLFAEIARRAENYYKSAEELLPLIAPESRPALKVLVSIYYELLERIERADYNVFTGRISVPTSRKLFILFRGLAAMYWARIVPGRK